MTDLGRPWPLAMLLGSLITRGLVRVQRDFVAVAATDAVMWIDSTNVAPLSTIVSRSVSVTVTGRQQLQ